MRHQIARIDLRLPERWCSWRPGEGSRVVARAAADLAGGPVAEARLRAALEAVDRAVVEQRAFHVRAGAWVPDPSGDVVAGLACELLAEAPDDEEPATVFLRRVRRKISRSRRSATRVAYHAVTAREVPAGDAVVTLRSHGVQRHEIAWTVFPPGAGGAVELRFDTRSLSRYQELIAGAERIVHDLGITVARPAERIPPLRDRSASLG